jgi:hypothetical protein
MGLKAGAVPPGVPARSRGRSFARHPPALLLALSAWVALPLRGELPAGGLYR